MRLLVALVVLAVAVDIPMELVLELQDKVILAVLAVLEVNIQLAVVVVQVLQVVILVVQRLVVVGQEQHHPLLVHQLLMLVVVAVVDAIKTAI